MKNKRLIGVSGKKRHGKDTVSDMIIEIMKAEKSVEYKKVAYGDKVKEVAAIMTGIPANEWETTEQKEMLLGSEWDTYDALGMKVPLNRRKFMTKLGSDVITSHLNRNAWVNAVFTDYTPESNWVVKDVRFYNEVHSIRDRGGILIRVTDPRKSSDDTHPSEVELDNFLGWDFHIANDGDLTDLKKKVRVVLTQIGLI